MAISPKKFSSCKKPRCGFKKTVISYIYQLKKTFNVLIQ